MSSCQPDWVTIHYKTYRLCLYNAENGREVVLIQMLGYLLLESESALFLAYFVSAR
jgi:hypothetical protein